MSKKMKTPAEFISKVSGGIMRSNRFLVELVPPRILNTTNDVIELFEFATHTGKLPDSTIGTLGNVMIHGREVKLAGDREFSPLSLDVYQDGNLKLWRMLNKWSNMIDSNKEIISDPSIDSAFDYFGSVSLYTFDNQGRQTSKITYNNIFPTNITGSDLDWSETNTAATFTVEFAVNYLEDSDLI